MRLDLPGRIVPLVAAAALLTAGCDVATDPDERLARAGTLLDAGKYNEAVVEIKNVLDERPDDARAQLAMARAATQLGLADSALAALERAAAAGADAAAVAELRARLHLQAGEHQVLLDALEAGRLPLSAPRRAELRARALMGLRRCDAAIEAAYALRAQAATRVTGDVVLAECFAHHGNAAAALRMLDGTVAANPAAAEAWVARGRLQQLSGLHEAAEQSWSTAARHAPAQLGVPQHLNMLASLAELQLKSGKRDAAAETHEVMVRLAPQGVLTALTRAQIDLARGQADEAVSGLRTLVTRNEKLESLRLVLASALLAAGSHEQALQQLGTLVARSPDARNLQQALESVRELSAMNRDEEEYGLRSGAAQMLLGQPIAARASLERAAAVPGASPRTREALARFLLAQGDVARAATIGEQLAQQQPDAPATLALRAEVLLAQGEFAKAAELLQTLWRRGRDATLAGALSRARELGGLAGADEPLRQWLQAHATDVRVRGLLADLLRRQGRTRESLAEYEKLAVALPASVPVLNNLAWLYYLEKDQRALATARRAAQLAPRDANVADTLGWLLVESGNVAEGSKALHAAYLAGGFANAEARYHLAAALARGGDTARARALLDRLLAEEADFPSLAAAKELNAKLAT